MTDTPTEPTAPATSAEVHLKLGSRQVTLFNRWYTLSRRQRYPGISNMGRRIYFKADRAGEIAEDLLDWTGGVAYKSDRTTIQNMAERIRALAPREET